MSTPVDVFAPLPTQAPDPARPKATLRDIFSAVASCNSSTTEIKGVKTEITFIRQDMQKLRDCAAALEGRLSILKDE